MFMPMRTEAIHLLVELHGCDAVLLNDDAYIVAAMTRAVAAAGATKLNHMTHRFSPQGVSAVVMVAESHFSIHTWPELAMQRLTSIHAENACPRLLQHLLRCHFIRPELTFFACFEEFQPLFRH